MIKRKTENHVSDIGRVLKEIMSEECKIHGKNPLNYECKLCHVRRICESKQKSRINFEECVIEKHRDHLALVNQFKPTNCGASCPENKENDVLHKNVFCSTCRVLFCEKSMTEHITHTVILPKCQKHSPNVAERFCVHCDILYCIS